MITCGRTKCIGEAIYSFMNQSYANRELIIFDTHLQDMIFDMELPSNIKYVKGNSHDYKSIGDKCRYVINLIDGDLFCMWEDDDIWLREHIEVLVREYERYKVSGIKSNGLVKVGHKKHYSMLGGVDKDVYSIVEDSNVCWQRYLYENGDMDYSNMSEPSDVYFVSLYASVYLEDGNRPTYVYRWDNGQHHMSGYYGQRTYEELYRMCEDASCGNDISNEVVSIGWRHDYEYIIKEYTAKVFS